MFFLTRDQHSDAEFQQRQTLVPVAAGLLRYGIYFAAVVMILREAGIDPTPLLAGAGVAGVALGLGAQAFVGDIVAGFFILFENLFLIGDVIEVGTVKGKVEEIGVRVTRIRDEAGVLHAIPNGEVRKVSSHSKGFVNVVVDGAADHGEPGPRPRLRDARRAAGPPGLLLAPDGRRPGRGSRRANLARGVPAVYRRTIPGSVEHRRQEHGFALLDTDHNGRITLQEWHAFMRDIFQSHQLNDASALVFGPGCRAGRQGPR